MKTPRFDKFQFAGRRAKATSADSGLAFSDFERMHVHRRERTAERRLCTPKWALFDPWLQELLVTYLEQRFYLEADRNATLIERRNAAAAAAERSAPAKQKWMHEQIRNYKGIAELGLFRDPKTGELVNLTDDEVLDRCADQCKGQQVMYADFGRAWLSKKSLHDLEIQIQNVDTDLVLTARGHAEMIGAVVYLFYRLGWDSVGVAEQLGLKPPHVRQVLARLHATWEETLEQRYVEKKKASPTAEPEQDFGPIFS